MVRNISEYYLNKPLKESQSLRDSPINKGAKRRSQNKIMEIQMEEIVEINFENIEEDNSYLDVIKNVIKTSFKEEGLGEKFYINIILTDPKKIKEINYEYRKIDKETDVLSFPMFEKKEIEEIIKNKNYEPKEVLGDIIISIEKVKTQAVEYGHSFERELAYMVVHGFYHLMGYDHMEENDKKQMREKEEIILNKLNILREE